MWEDIGNGTERLRVPEGWLVRSAGSINGGVALIFIADIRAEWVLVKKPPKEV